MIENVLVIRHKLFCAVFDGLQTGDDREAQIVQARIGLRRRVVDHAIDVALLVQLNGRYANLLRALLPGQVVAPRDVGKSFRLNGAEYAVLHRQNQIRRCQWNRAARIANAENNADVWHIDVTHLRDQSRNRVRLIVLVSNFASVCARGIHETDNRQRTLGKFFDTLRCRVVLRWSPHAVAHAAVLRDDADLPQLTTEVHVKNRGVIRAVENFVPHFAEA